MAAVVSLVHPVGADVCWKDILVPDGNPATPVAVTTTMPDVAGKVNVVVPDTAGAASVTVPEVSPAMTTDDIMSP
jgi:hypothetical protein